MFIEEKKAGVDWWRIEGDLTIHHAKEIHQAILNTESRSKRRMLDLSNLNSCDLAGMQIILSILKDSEQNGYKIDLPPWPECVLECAQSLGVTLPSTR